MFVALGRHIPIRTRAHTRTYTQSHNTHTYTNTLALTHEHQHTHAPLTLTPLTHTHPQTRDFINNELLSSFPIGRIDRSSGLCRPISYETTHQWMLTCGCKYKTFQKTYYNDTHERHDNQIDRVTKACRHLFVSLREEKWYCIPAVKKENFKKKYPDW